VVSAVLFTGLVLRGREANEFADTSTGVVLISDGRESGVTIVGTSLPDPSDGSKSSDDDDGSDVLE